MDKIYHVFISSTFSDLKDERKLVSDAIAKAGHVPEGMELFPASSQNQFDFIKRVIDRCDYYVLIVGARYGSLAPDGMSYTEHEYRYATERGIPKLGFIHRDPTTIEVGKSESKRTSARKLEVFRDLVKSSAMVAFWDSSATLTTSVVVALGQEINLRPGIGWIRGDRGIDPRLLEDLALTKKRVVELEAELSSVRNAPIVFPDDIASIDEEFTFELEYSHYPTSWNMGENDPGRQRFTTQTTWSNALLAIADDVYRGMPEDDLIRSLAHHVASTSPELPVVPKGMIVNGLIAPSHLRYQYEALGLITAVNEVVQEAYVQETADFKTNHPRRMGVVWKFTDMGRRYVSRSRAVKATEPHH